MNNKWFTVRKLDRAVWGIGEFQHFEEVISYLVVGRERALLVDTGLGIGKIGEVVEGITDKPVSVINTHGHFDHVGGNRDFTEFVPRSAPRIELEPFSFEIINTPGHSPDSICLYEPGRHWLFSGDTLYPGPIYLHMEDSSIPAYISSLEKLLGLGIAKVFPAHNDFDFPVRNIRTIHDLLTSKKILGDTEKIDGETSLLIRQGTDL